MIYYLIGCKPKQIYSKIDGRKGGKITVLLAQNLH